MIISHNLLAMNANRQFNITNKNKAKTTEKLSSGYRINRAADDAAGLSISEKMRRQIRGLSQGISNTEDGVSLCQVADGALAEVSNMLHRITELSVQSANGTNSDEDRKAIQQEISQIMQEIDRIGDTTEFNTQKIFVKDGFGGNKNYSPIIGYKTEIQTITHDKVTDKSFTFNVSGNPTDTIADTYVVSTSDSNGLKINGDTNLIKWDSIKDDSGQSINLDNIQTGNYSFKYKGMTIGFSIDENVNATDFKTALEGLSWSTQSSNDGFDVVFTGSIRGGSYTGSVYDNTDVISVQMRQDYNSVLKLDSGGHFGNYSFDLTELTNSNGEKFSGNSVNPGVYTGVFEVESRLLNGQVNNNRIKVDFSLTVNGTNPVNSNIVFANMRNNMSVRLLYFPNNVDNPRNLYSDKKDDSITIDGINYTPSYKKHETVTENIEIKIPIYGPKPPSNNGIANAIWIQSGSEAGQGMYLEIDQMDTSVLGINDLDVSTVDGANHALNAVHGALEKVSSNRSKIGAQQNRLEHTIANEQNVVENTTSAESRIRDTDMAKEMVEFSKGMILENVGQAMLAQANKSNQDVLSLLQ